MRVGGDHRRSLRMTIPNAKARLQVVTSFRISEQAPADDPESPTEDCIECPLCKGSGLCHPKDLAPSGELADDLDGVQRESITLPSVEDCGEYNVLPDELPPLEAHWATKGY